MASSNGTGSTMKLRLWVCCGTRKTRKSSSEICAADSSNRIPRSNATAASRTSPTVRSAMTTWDTEVADRMKSCRRYDPPKPETFLRSLNGSAAK